MENKWSEDKASEFIEKYAKKYGEDLALRTYSSRLIGQEKELVLHGGGNTSVKGAHTNLFGHEVRAIYVKASGHNLATIEPDGHTGMELENLCQLLELDSLADDLMVSELLKNRLDAHASNPSIEALMHAILPAKYIDHTHADSILALTNRPDGKERIKEVLGENAPVLDYVKPGFSLARAVQQLYKDSPGCTTMVLLKHGLITWGDTAQESYTRTIDLVSQAEQFLNWSEFESPSSQAEETCQKALDRYKSIAPVLRGMLALPADDADNPFLRFILNPLISEEILDLLDSDEGKSILLSPPLTSDHLIRTKPFPLWIDNPQYDDLDKLKDQMSEAIKVYANDYDAYFERYAHKLESGINRFDSRPRIIIMPGIGVICAGANDKEAGIVRDIALQTIRTKTVATKLSPYEGLSEEHLFDMEYFSLQHAKLDKGEKSTLTRSAALITGAAGAIGAGICQELLEHECHVVVTDLPGENLDALTNELKHKFGERIIGIPIDVTDEQSVSEGFHKVIEHWGGIDIIVVNAGIALVSSLADMDTDAFRKLERVNIEGTLLTLSEASRHFKLQGTGGDIILVSTKNVFAPGANFGAYSATKAASHQLARIASLELAGIGVRVNMVSPDGVFSHGKYKSGLWALVGPDRMKARNLDEKGLEAYYQNRNLLKAKITAIHVAKAVMYFASRQTPTTGATLPVDGGLPDATPR